MSCYTIATLAQRWQCCEDTVRRMIRAGRLQAFRVGNDWRISPETVQAFESAPHQTETESRPQRRNTRSYTGAVRYI